MSVPRFPSAKHHLNDSSNNEKLERIQFEKNIIKSISFSPISRNLLQDHIVFKMIMSTLMYLLIGERLGLKFFKDINMTMKTEKLIIQFQH